MKHVKRKFDKAERHTDRQNSKNIFGVDCRDGIK